MRRLRPSRRGTPPPWTAPVPPPPPRFFDKFNWLVESDAHLTPQPLAFESRLMWLDAYSARVCDAPRRAHRMTRRSRRTALSPEPIRFDALPERNPVYSTPRASPRLMTNPCNDSRGPMTPPPSSLYPSTCSSPPSHSFDSPFNDVFSHDNL